MPEINSPLGKKKITGQPMREFNVPDESEIENSVNPVFNAQRARAHAAAENVNLQAINDFQASLNSEKNLAITEKEIEEARAAKRAGRERLSEGAKKRIDMLLGMTRHTRECQIEGTAFVLQTLKAHEMREAIMLASAFDGTIQSAFEIRKQFLARALVQIGGIDIEQFIGSNNFEDKLIFVDELDDAFANRLYDEYNILAKETREKYAIKNEAEVQEVLNDLKK